MEKLPVSILIATFNEEAHLHDCLQSVLWAREIIVVDGGSTDKTQAIARQFTDKLLIEPNGPAETQRLKGVQEIRCPWFLILDADERVSPPLRDAIAAVIENPQAYSSYRVLRRNYRDGKPVHMHHPDYQLRFFKSSETGSLPDKIHRIPRPSGPAGMLTGELLHLFFTDWDLYQKKFEFYTSMEAHYYTRSGKRLGAADRLCRLWLKPAARFFQCYILHKAILDGGFGLKYAWKSGCYERRVAQKIIEAESGAD